MVRDWFDEQAGGYNDFVKSLLRGELKEMNPYMNRISLNMCSSFDGGFTFRNLLCRRNFTTDLYCHCWLTLKIAMK